MEYTRLDFIEAMAILDGYKKVTGSIWKSKNNGFEFKTSILPDYYFNLNALMPVIWKYEDRILDYCYGEDKVTEGVRFLYEEKERLKMYRDCLYQIAQERNR